MLTLAIIGAAIFTTTVIFFWNMPENIDETTSVYTVHVEKNETESHNISNREVAHNA